MMKPTKSSRWRESTSCLTRSKISSTPINSILTVSLLTTISLYSQRTSSCRATRSPTHKTQTSPPREASTTHMCRLRSTKLARYPTQLGRQTLAKKLRVSSSETPLICSITVELRRSESVRQHTTLWRTRVGRRIAEFSSRGAIEETRTGSSRVWIQAI